VASLPAMSVLGASEPSKIIPRISRDQAGTPATVVSSPRMPVAQLDPAHGARLFKCDRSCWKSGLRAARFTNAYQRRPSAPPRKMTADPVQCGGQPVPVHMLAFSRHVSIMRLLPLVDLRITRVFSCVARGLGGRASSRFIRGCSWRVSVVDGGSGTRATGRLQGRFRLVADCGFAGKTRFARRLVAARCLSLPLASGT
jgi:hypothetical protein